MMESHITDVVLHLGVVFVHELQQSDFNLSLIQKSLFILDDLDGDPLLLHTIVRLHHLPAEGDGHERHTPVNRNRRPGVPSPRGTDLSERAFAY